MPRIVAQSRSDCAASDRRRSVGACGRCAGDRCSPRPAIAAVVVALSSWSSTVAGPRRAVRSLVVSLGGLAIVGAARRSPPAQAVAGATARRVRRSAAPTSSTALTTFLDLLFISIVAFTIVFAPDYLEARGLPLAEFAIGPRCSR